VFAFGPWQTFDQALYRPDGRELLPHKWRGWELHDLDLLERLHDATGPAKLLVSACLLGHPVRHDGSASPIASQRLDEWRRQGRVIGICPELLGGFSTPRPAAEIAASEGGSAVLDGLAQVLEIGGADVSAEFCAGPLQLCKPLWTMAVNSPC
jgi:hypothetical protein